MHTPYSVLIMLATGFLAGPDVPLLGPRYPAIDTLSMETDRRRLGIFRTANVTSRLFLDDGWCHSLVG